MKTSELIKLIKDNSVITEETLQKSIDDITEPMMKELNAKIASLEKEANNKLALEKEGKSQTVFGGMGNQIKAIVNAGQVGKETDKRLFEKSVTGLGESVDSEGGFLLESEYINDLYSRAYDGSVLLKDCKRIKISKASIVFRALDESSRANGSRWGGIVAYWIAEAADITASSTKFKSNNLSLQKLTGAIYLTEEIMEDVVYLESMVKELFNNEMGFKVDDAIIRGTGVGQPLGILSSDALVTVAKETDQDADSIVAKNIEKMYNSLPAKLRGGAKFYINQDCEVQFPSLGIEIGTAGFPVYVGPEGVYNIKDAPSGRLKGLPIVPIEHCSALGDLGDIILANFGEYLVIEKGSISASSSIHVRFLQDEMVLKFVLRINGTPINNNTITAYKGGTERSPFVALAERA